MHARVRQRWAARLALPVGMLVLVGVAKLTPNRECLAIALGPFVRVQLPVSVPPSTVVRICVDGECRQASMDDYPWDSGAPANSWYAAAGRLDASKVTVRVVTEGDAPIDVTASARPRNVSLLGGCQHPRAVRLRYDPATGTLAPGS